MLRFATKFQPLAHYFETAYRAGYRHLEFWLDAKTLAGWQEIVRLANHYPYSYVLHFPNRLDQNPETLEHLASLYRALGCRCMVIHQPMYDRHHEAIARLAPELRLGVENHKLTPEGFDFWAERHAWLTLDVEHLWKFTLRDGALSEVLAAVRRLLERHAEKLLHVHMPGYAPGCDEHRPMYCSRELAFPVLSMLAEFGYEGQVVSEIDVEYQIFNDMYMDVLLFDTWRAQHDPCFRPREQCSTA